MHSIASENFGVVVHSPIYPCLVPFRSLVWIIPLLLRLAVRGVDARPLFTQIHSCGNVSKSSMRTHARLTTVSSDPQTPYCATWSYDSTGVMMQSYLCTTSVSVGRPFRYYYSLAPSIAGVLADSMTVTPSGFTSIATVMVRTFAVASAPDYVSSPRATSSIGSSSVLVTGSRTSTMAKPSAIHSSTAPISTFGVVAISMVLGIVIQILAIGAWCFLRRRKFNGNGCGIRSFRGLIPHPRRRTRSLGHRSSLHSNELAPRIRYPDAIKAERYNPTAITEAALQDHDDVFAPLPHGIKRDSLPFHGLSGASDISPPSCAQPSF